MRILVITACTGEKSAHPETPLVPDDFARGSDWLAARENDLAAHLTAAEDLYTGSQHVRLMRGVRVLRDAQVPLTLDLSILSAGYGLVHADRRLAPYECTFATMKKAELQSWAALLGVPAAVRAALSAPYDLALLLLGDSYLDACALDAQVILGGPTLVLCGASAAKKLPSLPNLRPVPLGNADAKRFSCGLVGLKGELAARILALLAADGMDGLVLLTDPETDLYALLDTSPAKPKAAKATQKKTAPTEKPLAVPRAQATANPHVDKVIQIPASWWEKGHRNRLRYFIPEWDDLVDPDYDFLHDTHSGGAGDWSNEAYAHQLYPEPAYDGILISKVVAEKSVKKKQRINQMGVHRFLRVPREFPIMGDCGAFGYIMQDTPPYTTQEILEYYTRLGFDYGVSLDHLIVSATEAQKHDRYELTLHNADEFLREHQKAGLPWEPIGAVQGWDPLSYAEGARRCVAMGYKYIGLGGLVRTSTNEIRRILAEVHEVVPETVAIHLFGIARVGALREFSKMGVRSVDSASLLRRAWMGTGQNYLAPDGTFYAAIRIPEAGKSFRAKRMVSEGRVQADDAARLEKAALQAVRDFDANHLSVDTTLEILHNYDLLITPDRADNRPLLRKLLEAQPWKTCPCAICQKDGIEVVLFRGNNRNRRRGFHNTFVFYDLVQRVMAGERVNFGRMMDLDETAAPQLSLFENAVAAA